MFCRVDIFNVGPSRKRVICILYKTGGSLTEIEEFAERERRAHRADGFRLLDLHTGKRKVCAPET
jgi:hypothetical protein